MALVPMVIRRDPRGERSFDISRGLRPLTFGFADLTPE